MSKNNEIQFNGRRLVRNTVPNQNKNFYSLIQSFHRNTMEGADRVNRTEDVEIKDNISFAEMMLSDTVLTGLTKNNFKNPSPIQLKAIPLGRCGMDLMIKSKSGTGKTLVFCTIALERYDALVQAPQSLIIVPTREVALQIEEYLNLIGASCKGFKAVSVIGGRDISEDRRRLSNCKTIVATLGRLLHLINNRVISIKQIKLVVLDEVDKLIGSDFRSNIDKLFKMFPLKPQMIASSATYADGLDKQIMAYMQNPAAISVTHGMPILIGIKQFVHVVKATGNLNNEATTPIIKMMLCKVEAIELILKNISFKQCILFSNSQMRAESFFSYLTGKGWTVDLIIGSHEQKIRTSTFHKFCKFESRILIASDVMARGIDVENVNLVINLDVPTDSSTYLHRIGRCGRFGTYGIAITLISDNMDMNKFKEIMGNIGGDDIKLSLLPSVSELDNTRLWDFSNEQSIVSIFNETDEMPNEGKSFVNYRENSSNVTESNQDGLSTQNKNIELLEISKLMLENKPTNAIQVDLDLFTDYSNLDVALNTAIVESNEEIQMKYSDQEVSSNEAINVTNEDVHMKRISQPDTSQNHAFVQAVKNLQISEKRDVSASIVMVDSKRENFNADKPDNSTYVATMMKKKAAKLHDPVRKSKSRIQNLWQNIYWQQFNQINQYFCWTKSSLPPKR